MVGILLRKMCEVQAPGEILPTHKVLLHNLKVAAASLQAADVNNEPRAEKKQSLSGLKNRDREKG